MGVVKATKHSAVAVFSGLVLTLATMGVASAGLIVDEKAGICEDGCDVNGDFVVEEGPGFPSAKPVSDDLCIIELPATFHLEGPLEGSFFTVFEIEHYGACDQYAEEYFYAEGTYEGEVLGLGGTFTFTFEGKIDAFGLATGELLIDEGSGTEELEGIGGELILSGPAGVSGSYSGSIIFS